MAAVINRDEVAARVNAGNTTLVEALPEEHWKKEHLPGAINLPHDQVDDLAAALLPDKQADIVVYCANEPCPNSTQAARRLTQLGYTNVFDYVGGKQDWIEAGLAVETENA